MAEYLRFQLSELTDASDSRHPAAKPARRPNVWPLALGRNRVGSDPGNDVPLATRGVSKFHAELHCTEEVCELEDLRSKNGSRVNGRRVRHQVLEAGDVISFGTSRWVLEAVPPDDIELALEIAASHGHDTTVIRATSKLEEDGSGAVGLPFPLLGGLLHRLRQRPHPDLEGALIDLVTHLGAAGACLVEWPVGEPTTVSAAVGRIGEVPERSGLADAQPLDFDPALGTLAFGDFAFLCVRLPTGFADRPPADFLHTCTIGSGLAVFGPSPGETSSKPIASALPWPVDPELLGSFLLLFEGLEALAEPGIERIAAAPRASDLRLPDGIVASTSGAMVSVYEQLAKIADDAIPVMVLGETGVGKEHLARALHNASDRRDHPFVAVNCAAIPAELLEAEMFGIGRGVATGVQARQGKFREADGGTLLLDEIGDMPLPLQAKLLRVLQEGEVTPLGESTVRVDVRLVSASHADLPTAIARRHFRQDLYYRLAGYVLRVPALRDRPDDLPVLLGHFLRTCGQATGRRVRGVTVKALQELGSQGWPGNVRQLQHVARRLVYLCPSGQAVDSTMVRESLDATELPPQTAKGDDFVLGASGLDDHLAALESEILRRALERTEGNQSKAARLLRISRNSLARRLNRLGIDPNRV